MGWLCGRCGKAQATYHITNIDGGEKIEQHLCERCAEEEGFEPKQAPAPTSEMLDKFVASARAQRAAPNLACEHCGISYVEFRNQGLLGCPHDYDVFKEVLGPLIERTQDGGTHHVGKTPRSKAAGLERTTEQDLHRLRRQLAEAVAAEDYERAAALRDRIRQAEEGAA